MSNPLNHYSKSKQTFENASGKLQTVLNNIGVKSNQVSVYPGVSLSHLLDSSYIVDASLAQASGATCLSSTEQLKVATAGAISYIDSLKDDKKAKQFVPQLTSIRKQLKISQDNAN